MKALQEPLLQAVRYTIANIQAEAKRAPHTPLPSSFRHLAIVAKGFSIMHALPTFRPLQSSGHFHLHACTSKPLPSNFKPSGASTFKHDFEPSNLILQGRHFNSKHHLQTFTPHPSGTSNLQASTSHLQAPSPPLFLLLLMLPSERPAALQQSHRRTALPLVLLWQCTSSCAQTSC
jgi:hypothetical protein